MENKLITLLDLLESPIPRYHLFLGPQLYNYFQSSDELDLSEKGSLTITREDWKSYVSLLQMPIYDRYIPGDEYLILFDHEWDLRKTLLHIIKEHMKEYHNLIMMTPMISYAISQVTVTEEKSYLFSLIKTKLWVLIQNTGSTYGYRKSLKSKSYYRDRARDLLNKISKYQITNNPLDLPENYHTEIISQLRLKAELIRMILTQ